MSIELKQSKAHLCATMAAYTHEVPQFVLFKQLVELNIGEEYVSLCDDIIMCATLTPTTALATIVGKLFRKVDLPTVEEQSSIIMDCVAMLAHTGAVKIRYGVSISVINEMAYLGDLEDYLNSVGFDMPMLEAPELVMSNRDSGYKTFSRSIIMGGNYHDYNVNLRHIDRANQVALRLDFNVIKHIEPRLAPQKTRETYEDYQKKVDNFYLMSETSAQYFQYLGDKPFYLTHRFDERLRTYAHGFQINTQGDDFRLACIQLANKELVQC